MSENYPAKDEALNQSGDDSSPVQDSATPVQKKPNTKVIVAVALLSVLFVALWFTSFELSLGFSIGE